MTNANAIHSQLLMNIQRALDQSAIVAITDPQGRITYANHKFCAISQYDLEELIGQNHRIVNSAFHPKDFFNQMWKTIASGQIWEGEIRNKAKDGSYYWVHTWIIPFIDENGKPNEYVSIRYDITTKKMAEQKNEIYSKTLENKNRELELFASIAAHDLQEPLRKLIYFSDRLRANMRISDGGNVKLDDDSRMFVDKIESSARRMQTLLEDLLSFSRVNMSRSLIQPVDLNFILKNVLSDLEVAINKSHTQIKFDSLATVEADPLQMHQLFMNLISNAIKFHRSDSPPDIQVVAKRLPNNLEIRISDNGIGIDRKYFDQIFGVFQRLHGKHEYPGNGMGLSICKRIVEKHHGDIQLESEIGKGTTFIVALPYTQPEPEVT